MSEMIFSMARIKGFSFSSNAYSFVYSPQGDGRREQHNQPHVHVYYKKTKLASISLLYPFDLISPKDINLIRAEHRSFIREAVGMIKDDTEYFQFLWDYYSRQRYFRDLNGWTQDDLDAFTDRFAND